MIIRRSIAVLIDIVLFVLYFLAWAVAYVFLAGFIEILFHRNAFEVFFPIAILIILTSVGLYFVVPLVKYKRTTGGCLVARKVDSKWDLRPLALYGEVLGAIVVAYFLTWGVSSLIFGAMARKQEKVVESMGMSLDWKSYYPPMDSLDNAAPYLNQAADSLTNKDAWKLLDWINNRPDTIAALSEDIDKCLSANRKALALLDAALTRHKLIWHDYHTMSAYEAMGAQPFPNYTGIESLVHLCFLDAVYAAYRGDTETSTLAISRGIGLLNLQSQDHTLISLLILNTTELRTTTNSLITLTKVAEDKQKVYPVVKDSREKILHIITGIVRVGLQAELANHAALLENEYGGRLNNLVFSIFDRIWGQWERYYTLQCAEYALRETAPGNTFETIDTIEKEYDKLVGSRMITVVMTSIVASNLRIAKMQKNELMYRAMLDATFLFAAALDYRLKHGSYPRNLQNLIPEYLSELPKSPIDHKNYTYKTIGDYMEVYALGPEGKHNPATTVIGSEP